MVKFLPILTGVGLYLGAIGATYGLSFNGFYSDEKTEQVVMSVAARKSSADPAEYRKRKISSLSSKQKTALGAPFQESYSKLKFLR